MKVRSYTSPRVPCTWNWPGRSHIFLRKKRFSLHRLPCNVPFFCAYLCVWRRHNDYVKTVKISLNILLSYHLQHLSSPNVCGKFRGVSNKLEMWVLLKYCCNLRFYLLMKAYVTKYTFITYYIPGRFPRVMRNL